MSDKITLNYYQQALNRLRKDINDFAGAYPSMASHLQVGPKTTEDPHISRLLETFALMTGRLDALVDDNYSRVTQGLIHNLYPSYLNHVPSMSIVKLSPYKTLKQPIAIPKFTKLESMHHQEHPYYFETGCESTIVPLQLVNLSIRSDRLSLHFQCFDEEQLISELLINRLRLYINSDDEFSMTLLSFLNNYTSFLSQNCEPTKAKIKLSGFHHENILLPCQKNEFRSYQQLLEFMCFKNKFFFFDMIDLDVSNVEKELIISINFSEPLPKQLYRIEKQNFQLNCIPIINLFKKEIEPLKVNHFLTDYPLITDKQYPHQYQIHHILTVKNLKTNHELLYNCKNSSHLDSQPTYRLHYHYSETNCHDDANITMSFSNSEDQLTLSPIELGIATYCSNGDLPSKLVLHDDDQHFQCIDNNFPIESIQCLVQPTTSYFEHLKSEHLSQLLALINQGQLGLYQPETAKESLISLLSLYNFNDNVVNADFIQSILAVTLRPVHRYIDNDLLAPVQYGVDITIHIDNHVNHSYLVFFEKILHQLYREHLIPNSFFTLSLKLEDNS